MRHAAGGQPMVALISEGEPPPTPVATRPVAAIGGRGPGLAAETDDDDAIEREMMAAVAAEAAPAEAAAHLAALRQQHELQQMLGQRPPHPVGGHRRSAAPPTTVRSDRPSDGGWVAGRASGLRRGEAETEVVALGGTFTLPTPPRPVQRPRWQAPSPLQVEEGGGGLERVLEFELSAEEREAKQRAAAPALARAAAIFQGQEQEQEQHMHAAMAGAAGAAGMGSGGGGTAAGRAGLRDGPWDAKDVGVEGEGGSDGAGTWRQQPLLQPVAEWDPRAHTPDFLAAAVAEDDCVGRPRRPLPPCRTSSILRTGSAPLRSSSSSSARSIECGINSGGGGDGRRRRRRLSWRDHQRARTQSPSSVMPSIGSQWVQTPRHGDPMCVTARHGLQAELPRAGPAHVPLSSSRAGKRAAAAVAADAGSQRQAVPPQAAADRVGGGVGSGGDMGVEAAEAGAFVAATKQNSWCRADVTETFAT
eukprot:COSAG01_NODE_1110_length_11657_cov_5.360616_13_plen_475_part_00